MDFQEFMTNENQKIKAGYVAIIGKPNVGKSTLMNGLIGQKLSIVTPKPQTTRKNILGILSDIHYQIIFLDTPGIVQPKYLLHKKMLEFIEQSLKDADILLFMIDISIDSEGEEFINDKEINEILTTSKLPKILAINKVDRSNNEKLEKLFQKIDSTKLFDSIIPISASLNFNLDQLLKNILYYLPEHPKYFSDDIVANESERFFVSELIREKIFELYGEEIPYSCEVVIEEFKERQTGKDYILANIYVEKDSQKKIIIGFEGKSIKKLGEAARIEIEKFLEKSVYLELYVKVRKNWRTDETWLKRFGYDVPKE
ncbi:MAG: GTPase Era [Ignavibacterium sp.]